MKISTWYRNKILFKKIKQQKMLKVFLLGLQGRAMVVDKFPISKKWYKFIMHYAKK